MGLPGVPETQLSALLNVLDAGDLVVRKLLGRGGFASVYSATYKGAPVALKVLEEKPSRAPECVKMLLREAACYKENPHENLVDCVGIVRIPAKFQGLQDAGDWRWGIVLELCETFTTKSLIVTTMSGSSRVYTDVQAYGWLTQIAAALAHLHTRSPPVIHRDIKHENVLLKRVAGPAAGEGGSRGGKARLVAKLADLGLHVTLEQDRSVLLRRKSTGLSTRSMHAKLSRGPYPPGGTTAAAASQLAAAGSSLTAIGAAATSSDCSNRRQAASGRDGGGGGEDGGDGSPFYTLSSILLTKLGDPSLPAAGAVLAAPAQAAGREEQQAAARAAVAAPWPATAATSSQESYDERRPRTAFAEADGPEVAQPTPPPTGLLLPDQPSAAAPKPQQPAPDPSGASPPAPPPPNRSLDPPEVFRPAAAAAGMGLDDGGDSSAAAGAEPIAEAAKAATKAVEKARSFGAGAISVIVAPAVLLGDGLDGPAAASVVVDDVSGRGGSRFAASAHQLMGWKRQAESAAPFEPQPAIGRSRSPALAAVARSPYTKGRLSSASSAAISSMSPGRGGGGLRNLQHLTPSLARTQQQQQQQAPSVPHLLSPPPPQSSQSSKSAAALPTGALELQQHNSQQKQQQLQPLQPLQQRRSNLGDLSSPARAAAAAPYDSTAPAAGGARSLSDPFGRGSSVARRVTVSGADSVGKRPGSSGLTTDAEVHSEIEPVAGADGVGWDAGTRPSAPNPRAMTSRKGELTDPTLLQPVALEELLLPGGVRRTSSVLKQLQQPELRQLRASSMEWVYGLTGRAGSCMYMAPEVYCKLPYNEKADVFSFAVLMYELLARELLLVSYMNTQKGANEGIHKPEDYVLKVCRGFRPARHSAIPDAAWALIEACWHDDPVQRPPMEEVVEELRRLLRGAEEAAGPGGGGGPRGLLAGCTPGCALM